MGHRCREGCVTGASLCCRVSFYLCAQHLGKHGIICIEDLIHEIYTCGPKFKEVSNFLYPFQLSSAREYAVAHGACTTAKLSFVMQHLHAQAHACD